MDRRQHLAVSVDTVATSYVVQRSHSSIGHADRQQPVLLGLIERVKQMVVYTCLLRTCGQVLRKAAATTHHCKLDTWLLARPSAEVSKFQGSVEVPTRWWEADNWTLGEDLQDRGEPATGDLPTVTPWFHALSAMRMRDVDFLLLMDKLDDWKARQDRGEQWQRLGAGP